jgi:hypothetical protein
LSSKRSASEDWKQQKEAMVLEYKIKIRDC